MPPLAPPLAGSRTWRSSWQPWRRLLVPARARIEPRTGTGRTPRYVCESSVQCRFATWHRPRRPESGRVGRYPGERLGQAVAQRPVQTVDRLGKPAADWIGEGLGDRRRGFAERSRPGAAARLGGAGAGTRGAGRRGG